MMMSPTLAAKMMIGKALAVLPVLQYLRNWLVSGRAKMAIPIAKEGNPKKSPESRNNIADTIENQTRTAMNPKVDTRLSFK